MGTTLKIKLETEVQDFQIFDFLDRLPYEDDQDEPTDLNEEAEGLCSEFILITYLGEWDDIDPTKFDGFNEIKLKIESYLFLKRHNPDLYKELDDTCPVPDGYSRLWR